MRGWHSEASVVVDQWQNRYRSVVSNIQNPNLQSFQMFGGIDNAKLE
jgi:hypothetical protein